MTNKVYEHEGALIAYGKRLDEIEHQINRIEKDKLIMEQGMTSFEKDIAELKVIVGHYHRDVEGEKWPKLGTKLGEKVAHLEAKVANLNGMLAISYKDDNKDRAESLAIQHLEDEIKRLWERVKKSGLDAPWTHRDMWITAGTILVGTVGMIIWGIMT